MTNEELKKKIVKILANCKCEECAVEYCADCEGNPSIEHCREKQQADALIAAGIGDMSDIRALADNVMLSVIVHKAEVSSMEQRAKEAEHRAAKAEKALQKFAENITCEDCPFFSDCASSEKMEDLIHSNHCFAEYLKQAEKELAEERKDD